VCTHLPFILCIYYIYCSPCHVLLALSKLTSRIRHSFILHRHSAIGLILTCDCMHGMAAQPGDVLPTLLIFSHATFALSSIISNTMLCLSDLLESHHIVIFALTETWSLPQLRLLIICQCHSSRCLPDKHAHGQLLPHTHRGVGGGGTALLVHEPDVVLETLPSQTF